LSPISASATSNVDVRNDSKGSSVASATGTQAVAGRPEAPDSSARDRYFSRFVVPADAGRCGQSDLRQSA
jgi:hypothetical protein